MKKYLSLVLILILFSCCFIGCAGAEDGESDCEHVFLSDLTYKVQTIDGEEKIFTKEKCSVCNKNAVVAGQIVQNGSKLILALNNLESGDVLYFKSAIYYSAINLSDGLENVTLWFEDGAELQSTIQLNSSEKMKNIKICNADFSNFGLGICIYSDVEGLIIENCKFKDSANIEYGKEEFIANGNVLSGATSLKDVVIKNCTFTDILNVAYDRLNTMAIKLANTENLTVTGCTFNGVQYNALNVGGKSFIGSLTITDNVFSDIGSRVLNLHLANLTSCDISGNTFYSNEDYYADTGKLGNYLGTEPEAQGIVFGINTWEEIPLANDINFENFNVAGITYNASAQLSLG